MEDLFRWLTEPHPGPQPFGILEMCLRAVGIYLAGWALLRIGGNRFLGRETAFDIVLGFVLGSTLSRAINGSAPLLVTLIASALLVWLHHLLAWLTWRSHAIGVFLKGRAQTLIRDGRIVPEGLRKHRISEGDLDEALRLNGSLDDPGQVKEARFERNGDISVIKRETREPRVLEVRVQDGVQTVRIEIA